MITFTTRANDRWDLIAGDLWQLPELGWAIAEANPDIADSLVLRAGISLILPELRSLRRPLTAANPAREDDGEFQQLPPQPPSPIVPPSGGGGSVVFPITIAQGGTGGVTAQEALQNLGAVALASVGAVGGIAGLDGSGKVSAANLPPFQSPLTFPIAVNQGGTGANTAAAARANLGAIALSDVPASIPPSAIGVSVAPLVSGLVPVSNLPLYPTLSSLGGIPLTQKGAVNGVAPLDFNSLVPSLNLPPYPTLASLGALAASSRGAANGVAPLSADALVPVANLPQYPTLASLGAASLSANQTFSGLNKFSGVFSVTGSTTNLIDLNVGAIANAYYWFNPTNTANVGQRLSDIVKISNGNLVLRHLTDNYSAVTFQWQFTASGNLICPGMVQAASFASNPTGASFIPGGFYYNTTLGCLVYSGAGPAGSPSAGTISWRRMDTNAIVT